MYLGKDDLPRIVRIVMVALGLTDGSVTISALNYYRFAEVQI